MKNKKSLVQRIGLQFFAEPNTRLQEIEERVAAILEEMSAPDADIDALTEEVRTLKTEKTGIIEQRREQRTAAAREFSGQPGRPAVPPEEVRTYDAGSPEYRNAFFKDLLGLEMTKEERAAFTHTTANTPAMLPTTTLNMIWDLVSGQHAILNDITIYRTGTIIEVIKHTTIVQGKAKKVAENTANDDEQNTFVKVTLSGNDFSKHVNISYAMAKMSIEALEAYLVNEISAGLGEAMADDVVATIRAQMAAGNKVSSAAANAVTYKELATLFAKLKRVGTVCAYMTRSTLFTHLVGMTDTTGRPIFQPTAQDGAQGVFLGAIIKIEDSVGENAMLIGDPKKVTYNMVQDIMVEQDKDIKAHVITYSGYARGEGALIDDVSFAELTITTA